MIGVRIRVVAMSMSMSMSVSVMVPGRAVVVAVHIAARVVMSAVPA